MQKWKAMPTGGKIQHATYSHLCIDSGGQRNSPVIVEDCAGSSRWGNCIRNLFFMALPFPPRSQRWVYSTDWDTLDSSNLLLFLPCKCQRLSDSLLLLVLGLLPPCLPKPMKRNNCQAVPWQGRNRLYQIKGLTPTLAMKPGHKSDQATMLPSQLLVRDKRLV